MSETLFDLGPSGFQMQSWHIDRWTAMEDGAASKVWAPRSRAEDAVHKCLEWTGLICIPAMRVVDLSTSGVVWQDTHQYPEAGEMVIPGWAPAVYERVRAEFRAEASTAAAAGVLS